MINFTAKYFFDKWIQVEWDVVASKISEIRGTTDMGLIYNGPG